MKISFSWQEGRETRVSEGELLGKDWEQQLESIKLAYKKALKFSSEPIPTGLLSENEVI